MTEQTTMKAVLADKLGNIDNYRMDSIAIPALSDTGVLVKVAAAGVGYADVLIATGAYQVQPPLPFVPGSEFAGVVAEVGKASTKFSVGQRVCGFAFGNTFAEFISADEQQLFSVPKHLPLAAAASFLVNFQTAMYAFKQRANLQAGETVLVLGAAGGVGSAAIQTAKAMGATVIAAASTHAKRDFTLSIGADIAIDYTQNDWRDEVKKASQGRGVDVVFDPVGGAVFEPAFRSLAWGGRHLVIGFVGGDIPKLPANLPLLKGAALVGVDVRQFGVKEPTLLDSNNALLWQWLSDRTIEPPIGPIYAFEQYAEALTKAFSGQTLGKVVLDIANASEPI